MTVSAFFFVFYFPDTRVMMSGCFSLKVHVWIHDSRRCPLSNDEREKVYKSLEEKVMEINSLKTKAIVVFDIKLYRITVP